MQTGSWTSADFRDLLDILHVFRNSSGSPYHAQDAAAPHFSSAGQKCKKLTCTCHVSVTACRLRCLAAAHLVHWHPGLQAQTAECIVLGEIATDRIIVVLSKIDLLLPAGREKLIAKAQKLVKATFQATRFAGCAILPVSVKPGESTFSPCVSKLMDKNRPLAWHQH